MRKRIQSLVSHLFTASMALTESLRIVIETPKSFLDSIEISAFLGGKKRGFLSLHGLGALIRHVICIS